MKVHCVDDNRLLCVAVDDQDVCICLIRTMLASVMLTWTRSSHLLRTFHTWLAPAIMKLTSMYLLIYFCATCSFNTLIALCLHCVSVAYWHSARWARNGYQPGLGSIPRPSRV